MKKNSIIFLIVGALSMTGCMIDVSEPYFLHTIQNLSGIDVFSYQAANTENAPTVYPDTLVPEVYRPHYYAPEDTLGIIPPNTCGFDWCLLWEGITKWSFNSKWFNKEFPGGFYSVFIISYDTYKEKGWEGIRNDYDILVRYDLTYDDLKALKDTIPFPPTEKMKDMKMYPPYEEIGKKYLIK